MGRDFSGTVAEVGSSVTNYTKGDEVFGLLFQAFGQGTFSEYININPASNPIAKKPNCFTHEQAASIPLVALTAYACLDWLPPQTGSQRRVIIRGASGGTGMWLVQLAKVSYDCHVTAICSSKNAAFVKDLGADEVIDYTSQNIVSTLEEQLAANGQSDLIVDCVGGTELLDSYERILHKQGAYVTIVGDKTDVKTLGGPVTYFNTPAQVIRFIKGWIWGPRYACVSLLTKSEYLEKIVGLAERGEVRTEVQEVIEGAFDERQGWKRATKAMEDKRTRGKIVLAIP
ncbi:quinone oxidoreductase [Mollisia scopiformis]|uniref:Quinone oxidoreductase n=1 Tax=Mollisia scopiformis TaxID=149040 RepID=A0A194XW75_MOLSC|nr:quinone oxidoreductase [Mollisia scopiformis]KUJ24550.1 quinone oxidoreductase [Mollisia scopiformis]